MRSFNGGANIAELNVLAGERLLELGYFGMEMKGDGRHQGFNERSLKLFWSGGFGVSGVGMVEAVSWQHPQCSTANLAEWERGIE